MVCLTVRGLWAPAGLRLEGRGQVQACKEGISAAEGHRTLFQKGHLSVGVRGLQEHRLRPIVLTCPPAGVSGGTRGLGPWGCGGREDSAAGMEGEDDTESMGLGSRMNVRWRWKSTSSSMFQGENVQLSV